MKRYIIVFFFFVFFFFLSVFPSLVCIEVFAKEGRVIYLNRYESFYGQIDVSQKGKANTVYIIRKNYDLKGKTVVLPNNCSLVFKGGVVQNGSLVFNNTSLIAEKSVFRNINVSGTLANQEVSLKWFSPKENIAALLSWVIGNRSVSSVIIPNGRYYVSDPVLLKSDLVITGESKHNTFLVADRSYVKKYPNKFVMLSTVNQKYIIQGIQAYQYDHVEEYAHKFRNIVIRNITFDLNYYGDDNECGQMAAIKLEDASNAVIENCSFIDHSSKALNHTYHAVYFVRSKDCEVTNCYTEDISFAQCVNSADIVFENNIGINSIGTWLESNDGSGITYLNNTLEGVQSMTSAISFNSKSCLASHNTIRTSTPVICGIVLGHPNQNGFYNCADDCVLESNFIEVLGDGLNDYGILVQNGHGIRIVGNKVLSSNNTIRIGQAGQALLENNEFCLQNVRNYNLFLNTMSGLMLKGNKITDSGIGKPEEYNIIVYLGGDAILEDNVIESNVTLSRYNLIWAAPGGNVRRLIVKNNNLKRISMMGHVLNLVVEYNTFDFVRGHLFSNSVNAEGITRSVKIVGNNVKWESDNVNDTLVYLTGLVESNINPRENVEVYDNVVNVSNMGLIRYDFNYGQYKALYSQEARIK